MIMVHVILHGVVQVPVVQVRLALRDVIIVLHHIALHHDNAIVVPTGIEQGAIRPLDKDIAVTRAAVAGATVMGATVSEVVLVLVLVLVVVRGTTVVCVTIGKVVFVVLLIFICRLIIVDYVDDIVVVIVVDDDVVVVTMLQHALNILHGTMRRKLCEMTCRQGRTRAEGG
jgi:hypothetical protein